MATAATRREKTFLCEKKITHYEPRIPLTPTGLLMEGDYTHNPAGRDFKCNGDVAPIDSTDLAVYGVY
jgi:hypothetical protein